jgi:F0F1-type ATP synthase assembly protein I
MPEQKPPKKKQPPTDKEKSPNAYAKYSGMALQMGATIGLGVWGGTKLDHWLQFTKFPVFTVILSLLSVFGAMYIVIKDVLKK